MLFQRKKLSRSLMKGCLGVGSDPMWGSGTGMSMCSDCKALWDKFVKMGETNKLNWIENWINRIERIQSRVFIIYTFYSISVRPSSSTHTPSSHPTRYAERRGDGRKHPPSSRDQTGCFLSSFPACSQKGRARLAASLSSPPPPPGRSRRAASVDKRFACYR